MPPKSLILLAHGSRDPNWCATFETGQQQIARQLSRPVRLAYMEMAQPSLEEVVTQAYQSGQHHLEVLPLFFAEGRHLLHDVPAQLRALEASLSGCRITLLPALGTRQGFWSLVGNFLQE